MNNDVDVYVVDDVDVDSLLRVDIPHVQPEQLTHFFFKEETVILEKKEEVVGVDSRRFVWPSLPWSWQDFLPSKLAGFICTELSCIPSLLDFVPEVSDVLYGGAYWFNFAFEWWFTVPLHTTADDDNQQQPQQELNWSCTKCSKKFKQDWEVPKHFIEVHALAQKKKSPEPNIVEKVPEVVVEELPEVVLEPLPLEDQEEDEEECLIPFDPFDDPFPWDWEDFLPVCEFDLLQQYLGPEPEPEPKPEPEPEYKPKPLRELYPAPVLKQTKYFCSTCMLTICNSCFTKKCSSHKVDWMGQAKFGCEAC